MTYAHELISSDLEDLADCFIRRSPRLSELSSADWLAVVGRLATDLIEEARGIDRVRWGWYADAVENAFAHAVGAGGISKREGLFRSLNLTSALLRQVPPVPGISLLDPDHQVDLVMHAIPLSAAAARELSRDWKQLDLPRIAQLREAKLLLSPVLYSLQFLKPGSPRECFLREWEGLYSSLP
ncbi:MULTISPECIES: hypothetical protein [unclassified Streptomyces]|uniref:hypothetical protein n=1 Tax=unclassified Streptomyces TaxID=2593676 RepID=UPI001BEB9A46|nr:MULTISPECIES: hypothetical protein [unclassified Streptomyces]MBT2407507.1 hypothetical protein [Streptomyces sp. ISL-21]MBT2612608.1 hypothetical protein [Streptomyces sp. ISL-87]